MAALYGTKYVFAHIPKCGGKWTRRAMEAVGFPLDRDLSDGHAPAPGISNPRWVSFTFIRHPATWLASWWAYCERTGWCDEGRLPESFDPDRPYDRMMRETSAIKHTRGFDTWVRELERYQPGYVASFFAPFMRSVQIVGRQETLKADLSKIIGVSPDLPPFNVGDNVPPITDELFDFIAENEPLESLGYESGRLARYLTTHNYSVLTSQQKGQLDSR